MFNKIIIVILFIKYSMGMIISKNNNNSINQHHNLFPLSIIHINDFHARYEQISKYSATNCNPEIEKCIGGYARVVHVVKELKNALPNPIYLNAGDNFQGTIWYNAGRWNITSYFLNLLPPDVMTIGNHDFDHGIEGIVPFLDRIKSPIVVCNIDDSEEPKFQGKYQKSIIIEKYGRKIGVIGVILSSTSKIASTGNLKFLNESQSILNETGKLKSQGVNIIIVLSHCSLQVDKEIARICGDEIDIIVGGHSHTLMFNGTSPNNYNKVEDYYPTTVNGVLIVQAWALSLFIGNLTMWFDEFGKIVNYDGAPIYLDTNVQQDSEILRELKPWKEYVDSIGKRIVGTSSDTFDKLECQNKECNLGNLITDSFVNYYINKSENINEWTYASIVLINSKIIQHSLNEGTIIYENIVNILPFNYKLHTFELRGDHLQETMEFGFGFLQISGLKVIYNISNPIGNRVVSIDVLCNKCKFPVYEPLNTQQMYRIIASSNFVAGYSSFDVIRNNYMNYKAGGPMQTKVLKEYIQNNSPIVIPSNSGRIKYVK